MAKVLSEINWQMPDWVEQPVNKIRSKLYKKDPKMLEEQIRDYLPCDTESEEEKNEEF